MTVELDNPDATIEKAATASAFAPFRSRIFAMLWTATVVSNIGTWMYAAAAGWQMTVLDPSPRMVSLVQAVSTLPIFLFALPAGALADIVDRRKLLIIVQSLLMGIVFMLAVLTLFDRVTPVMLLAFTFATGLGAALVAPAWQAIVPDLVPRRDLQAAIALNSVGINVSRAVGPALAGVLIAWLGIASPYFVDAVSFLGVIAVLVLWRRRLEATELPAEHFVGAMRAGMRYARDSGPLRSTLIRAAAFFFFASGYWALLPLVAKERLADGSLLYSLLLTCLGVGAVVGAFALPQVRRAIGPDRMVAFGTLITAAAVLALALVREAVVVATACLALGVGWIAVLSSLNVAAQVALPAWVKARGLSIYLVAFFGAMTLGSVFWGQVADSLGISVSLLVSAAGLIVASIAVRRWRLPAGDGSDFVPSMHWPAPILADGHQTDRGPVMTTVEYTIDARESDEFLSAMHELAGARRRNGAFAWGLFEDAEEPGRYLEYFLEASWLEHLRHHRRVTEADRTLQERVRRKHTDEHLPRVRHFLAAPRHVPGKAS